MNVAIRMFQGKQQMGVPYLHRPPGEYLWMPFMAQEQVKYDRYLQTYSFTPAGGKTLHFHVGGMIKAMESTHSGFAPKKLGTYQISAPQVQYAIKSNGITPEELMTVDPATIDQPGIMLLWPDTTQTIIDGNHRYVLRHFRGLETMDFYLWDLPSAMPYLLDLPQDMGIDEQNKGMGERHDLQGTYMDEHGVQRVTATDEQV